MQQKYMLIVKVPRGLIVRDRPGPEGAGARALRAEPVGKVMFAFHILNVEGVDYAALIPQNPLKSEWVRVAERDHSIEYVDVIPIESESVQIQDALLEIANAIRSLHTD
jgi:hypothetical protein